MNKMPLALAALFAAPAMAGITTLDFETAPSFASIGNLYAAVGVSFGPDALGLQNDSLGPYFSNAPSPVGVLAVVGPDSVMNVTTGFYAMSFYYSSPDAVADALEVWSGLDGTGTLLGTFGLQSNATTGCTDSAYCNWSLLSRSFSGVAHSVTFSAGAQLAAFDNIALVPEPATVLLAGLAMTALLASRRRG